MVWGLVASAFGGSLVTGAAMTLVLFRVLQDSSAMIVSLQEQLAGCRREAATRLQEMAERIADLRKQGMTGGEKPVEPDPPRPTLPQQVEKFLRGVGAAEIREELRNEVYEMAEKGVGETEILNWLDGELRF